MSLSHHFDRADRHYLVINLIFQIIFFLAGPKFSFKWFLFVVGAQLVTRLVKPKEGFWEKYFSTVLLNFIVFFIGLLAWLILMVTVGSLNHLISANPQSAIRVASASFSFTEIIN